MGDRAGTIGAPQSGGLAASPVNTLAQAYSLLVPVRERPVGGSVKEFEHEDSSDLRTGVVGQQREANTIASQTASLIEFAKNHDLEVPEERVFKARNIVERRWSRRPLSVLGILPPKDRSRWCWRTRQTG
jgi:hypothetical protein